jgi:rod shape-determining protein MreD
MRFLLYVTLVVLITPLQTTVIEALSIGGVKPDLGLVAVLFVGYLYGELDGLVVGGLVGLMLDLFSGGLLGANLVTKMSVGVVSGLLGRLLLDLTPLTTMLVAFTLSLAAGCLFYLVILLASGGVGFGPVFIAIILPQACYDAILGAAAFRLLRSRMRSRYAPEPVASW